MDKNILNYYIINKGVYLFPGSESLKLEFNKTEELIDLENITNFLKDHPDFVGSVELVC